MRAQNSATEDDFAPYPSAHAASHDAEMALISRKREIESEARLRKYVTIPIARTTAAVSAVTIDRPVGA